MRYIAFFINNEVLQYCKCLTSINDFVFTNRLLQGCKAAPSRIMRGEGRVSSFELSVEN